MSNPPIPPVDQTSDPAATIYSLTSAYPDGTSTVINNIPASAIDQTVAAGKWALGFLESGLIERLVTAAMHAILLFTAPLIKMAMSLLDVTASLLVSALTAAQGEGTRGFYELTAALLEDLTGVGVNPDTLFNDFQSGGRVVSVQAFGASIVNLLASEFVGQPQAYNGQTFTIPDGQGAAGLPVATLSPTQGVEAAQTFLGFALEFAAREGNVEALAGYMPYGIGEPIRALAVNMAGALNLGRMGRIALMPLFKTLIATPLQWALNMQYQPTLLGVSEIFKAAHNGDYDSSAVINELSMHGYSGARQDALANLNYKFLSGHDWQILQALGQPLTTPPVNRHVDADYPPDLQAALQTVRDVTPARNLVLGAINYLGHEFMLGAVSATVLTPIVTNAPLLTAGERAQLLSLISTWSGLNASKPPHTRMLTRAELETAYENGFITLLQYEQYLSSRGYQATDIPTLVNNLLVKAEKAAAAAAKNAATSPIPNPASLL